MDKAVPITLSVAIVAFMMLLGTTSALGDAHYPRRGSTLQMFTRR